LLNKVSKFWLLLLIISAIVWLGAINVRFIIGNELLNYDEFSFRTSIPPDEENMIFKLISNVSIVIMIAYVFTFVSAIFFMKTCKINLKQNAWLLMCSILFFIFSPVEFYTSYLDLKFILLFFSEPPNHDELLKIFGERLGFLKGVPWIAILSYYTIIGIAIFKPLKKTQKELDEDKIKTDEHSYKYYLHEDDDIING
jgi:hypothetical protein